MNRCKSCGTEITGDDKGLHKKLRGRFETEFICISCNAAYFNVPERFLRQKIDEWREMGCSLFTGGQNEY